MKSIVTVTAAAASRDLTTLARVKQEIGGSFTAEEEQRLQQLLTSVSKAVENYLHWELAVETVSEAFRLDLDDDAPEWVLLRRLPVTAIASVTLDGVAVASTLYEVDAATGRLVALDASGYRCRWYICRSLIVAYSAGYVLPGISGATLPGDIELGTLAWIRSAWLESGRDPKVKREEIPGMISRDYWVGVLGEDNVPPAAAQWLDPLVRHLA